jgi:group I intron endonuclease
MVFRAHPKEKTMAKRNDYCTIYLLTNTENGKIYVGQSWYPTYARMGRDGSNYSHSPYIYNAIKLHGVDKFKYTVLEACKSQEEADRLEDIYVDKYNSLHHDIGYNIKKGGQHGLHTEETKAKISATLQAQFDNMTQEEKNQRAAPVSGYWLGKERGPLSEERKVKIGAQTKERHATIGHPMQGKHHTEEAKEKISKSNTGRKLTPEQSKARSKPRKSQEIQDKIVRDYNSGMSVKEVRGANNNLSITQLYRVLDRYNVPLRESPEKRNKQSKGRKAQIEKDKQSK